MPLIAPPSPCLQSSVLSSTCTARPDVALYAPAYVSRYTYEVVLAFSTPFNLTAASCGSTYTCLLGIGSKGVIQAGSAAMLEPGGQLYSIQVGI
jgi:hypothetical protein